MTPQLPYDRSATYTDADPLPPEQTNELQDAIKGRWFKSQRRKLFPTWTLSGGSTAALCVINPLASGWPFPVWKLASANFYTAMIPYDSGDRIIGMSIQVYGDGAVDWDADVTYIINPGILTSDVTPGHVVDVGHAGESNAPASWHTVNFGSVVNTALGDDGVVFVQMEVTAPGGNLLYVSYVTPIFDRVP